MKLDDYLNTVNERLISIAAERNPWNKPWRSQQIGFPANPITKKRYTGFNALWLDLLSGSFLTSNWATFNQIKDAGGMVRKGEKATHILRPIELKKTFENAAGEDEEGRLTLFTPYPVFNFSQADGMEQYTAPPLELRAVERRPDIDAAIAATGAKIHDHPTHCFYRPMDDTIHMVPAEQFESIEASYGTTFHELGHWTGSKDRLNRDLTGKFKTHAYAAEELIAEIASSYLCHHLNIDGLDRHQGAYLGNWCKLFEDDRKAILRAAGEAHRAFRFIVPEVVA